MNDRLDAIVARVQNLAPFNIWEIRDDGTIGPWYEVGPEVATDLVIRDELIGEAVRTITLRIMEWGRLVARARRVWEITERAYRMWRDARVLELITPPPDEPQWKKPTQAEIDARVRTDPQYAVRYQAMERAEEAHNAALAVLDGYRAKKEMLRGAVIRASENAAPRLSV